MLENYVKFLRGTPSAYEKLANKNADTLYFISEPEAATGMLYLGSKLIAGGISSDLTLSDLKGITLSEDIAAGQILVYDSEKGWVNADLEEAIGVFQGAGTNPDHAGLPGLVPAPAAGQTNAYLRSDGTWATIEFSQNITTKVNGEGVAHSALLAEIENPVLDDITIIKDIIVVGETEAENKYQHTAYIYDGNAWTALDGNYSAENVYFKDDFTFTESVGTVAVPAETGSTVVSAAGLNVKQFLSKIFAEEKDPTVTLPSVTLTMSPKTTSYEVGDKLSQGYSINFNSGSYQYGPSPTGVTRTSVTVTDSKNNTLSEMTGTFPEQTITDGFSYTVSCYASYGDGVAPKTNLGNDCASKKITSGDTTTKTSSTITGYRKTFFGCATEKKDTLTSADIRALSSSSSAYSNGKQFDVSVTKGCLRVIIAYPASLRNMTEVLDVNDSSANIISGFNAEPIIVKVEGKNGYESIDYKVYKIDFANPYDANNTFKVKI